MSDTTTEQILRHVDAAVLNDGRSHSRIDDAHSAGLAKAFHADAAQKAYEAIFGSENCESQQSWMMGKETQPDPSEAPKAGDPFCIDGIQAVLDQGMRKLFPSEIQWLIEEAYRLHRANRAADARLIQLESELKAKGRDFSGLMNEWHDLSDENRILKQQAEVDRVVGDSRDATIEELRRQLQEMAAMSGTS